MTDSRVDDSTPLGTKTDTTGAPSQKTDFIDDLISGHDIQMHHSANEGHSPPHLDAQVSLPIDTIQPQTSQHALQVLPNTSALTAHPLPLIVPEQIPLPVPPVYSSTHLTISELAASLTTYPLARRHQSNTLHAKTPAVLTTASTDQGIVYEWDFWRPHSQYLSDVLSEPEHHIPHYRRSLMESCGLVAAVLAHYDLLHVSEVTFYAFSAMVEGEVQYRYQPQNHPMQYQPAHQQQSLYYPAFEIPDVEALSSLLHAYFDEQVLPTELEFAGQGDIVGVGRFENPFSFTYEVFESFERIRLQTRSTAWLTCDLNAMPQMALYAANGWRLENAMTDLVFFLGQQGFQLEQNQREKTAFNDDYALNLASNATRYADWDGDYLVNRSTLEPESDQLLDVVNLFGLNVDYAEPV
ncbi:hypothetical protein [Aquirhabdus parva]|uniref:Uncharacterized protein n=1 Tax=Aquirhabdus parva TaxID=2283318 RepID=A0A345P8I4_9GAMM|nr:hypothetical protein [Aquirhabdus parva]AXI03593.1 hypothetical protein HYN46_12595 [Aquirhabdus parva]